MTKLIHPERRRHPADSSGRRVWPESPIYAFPQSHAAHGMTLRDWFATHAPEVPEWFQTIPLKRGISITEALQQQPDYKLLTPADLERLRQADCEGDLQLDDLPKHLHDIAVHTNRTHAEAWNAHFEAQRNHPRERFFAWRWYYADQMMAGRSA